jgi:uncharacterized sulfatase
VKPPEPLFGKSLLPLLKSENDGVVDASRDWSVSGRERHVGVAREENMPYPMRSLRTREFLYIRNFAPERWPMGAPYAAAGAAPSLKSVDEETRAAFPDMDASPTKTWLIAHRQDPAWNKHFEVAFGKRPAEELYDIKNDPDQTRNLAADAAFAETREAMSGRLMKLLQEANDPRVTGDGNTFDRSPFTDPEKVRSKPAVMPEVGANVR